MAYKTLFLYLFIFLLTAIGSQRASAQKDIEFQFDTFRHISGEVCFNAVKVIDNRVNKNLGYVKKKGFAADKPRYLVMQGDFSKNLEAYIQRLVSGEKQQDNELLLVVYDMYAEDEPVPGNNIVTFYLRVDVLIGKDDTYRFLMVIDSLYEVGTDQDASQLVQRTIGNTIKDLVTAIGSTNISSLNGSDVFTLQDAKDRVAEQKKKYAIYNEQHKSGLYTSYEQFLKNEPLEVPVIVESIIITETQRKTFFGKKTANGKKGEKLNAADYYAVYTDGKWYFSHKGELQKMKFEDGDFYTELKRPGLYNAGPIYSGSLSTPAISAADRLFPADGQGVYKARIDVMRKGALRPVKRINKLL